jgi:thiol-disulfide isomerase/thioredoxin
MNSIWIVSMVLQWAVIVVLSLVALSLMRQVGQLTLRLNGVKERADVFAPFSEIQEHSLSLVDGRLFQFGGPKKAPAVLVFFAPKCGACETVPAALQEFVRKFSRDEVSLLAVIDVERAAAGKFIAEKSLQNVPVAVLEDFPEHLKPGGVPFGVAIATDGRVAARGKPKTLTHLAEMVETARNMVEMASPHSRRKHEWGESAPYWPSEGTGKRQVTNDARQLQKNGRG